MKGQIISSLGLDVTAQVPDSVAEFDANAKSEGACLREGTSNIIYRSWLPVYRDTFLHGDVEAGIVGVEQETGIARKLKTKTENGTEVPTDEYDETEGKYFARVCAELKRVPASFQDLANKVAASIPFDASASASRGPKKPNKTYINAAQAVINAGKQDAVAAALGKLLGITLDPTVESLAKGIALNEARKRAKADAKLAGDLLSMAQP